MNLNMGVRMLRTAVIVCASVLTAACVSMQTKEARLYELASGNVIQGSFTWEGTAGGTVMFTNCMNSSSRSQESLEPVMNLSASRTRDGA